MHCSTDLIDSETQVEICKPHTGADCALTQATNTEQSDNPFAKGQMPVMRRDHYVKSAIKICRRSQLGRECVCVIGESWPDAPLPFSGIICLKLSTLSQTK